MGKTIRTKYDGQVLLSEDPIDLARQTCVRATIEVAEKKSNVGSRRRSFLETAQVLNLEGLRDGARRSEEYLYGER